MRSPLLYSLKGLPERVVTERVRCCAGNVLTRLMWGEALCRTIGDELQPPPLIHAAAVSSIDLLGVSMRILRSYNKNAISQGL
jgi:hypothetical protein